MYKGKISYSFEEFSEAVNTSKSKSEALNKLGLPYKGGSYGNTVFRHHQEKFSVSLDHFKSSTEPLKIYNDTKKIPIVEILNGMHPTYGGSRLAQRVIKEGIFERKCSNCLRIEWEGTPIPIELDHINGKPWDHRLENIRLLCRNCHGQTDNFCGKNTKGAKKKRSRVQYLDEVRHNYLNAQSEKIKMILDSDIDFYKYGWVTKASKIIDMSPQTINRWMKKVMPEFYEKCYKRTN